MHGRVVLTSLKRGLASRDEVTGHIIHECQATKFGVAQDENQKYFYQPIFAYSSRRIFSIKCPKRFDRGIQVIFSTQRLLPQWNCPKKRCSDFDESGTSRLESIKCGANLVSDEKVGFSPKNLTALIPVFNSEQPQVCPPPHILLVMRRLIDHRE